MFLELDYERVIIIEDDMEISIDFFDFFLEAAPLLDKDPTVFCVSAWNDHGQVQYNYMIECSSRHCSLYVL